MGLTVERRLWPRRHERFVLSVIVNNRGKASVTDARAGGRMMMYGLWQKAVLLEVWSNLAQVVMIHVGACYTLDCGLILESSLYAKQIHTILDQVSYHDWQPYWISHGNAGSPQLFVTRNKRLRTA